MGIHETLAEASGTPPTVLLLGALRTPIEKSMEIDVGSRRTPAELSRIVDAHALIVERVCASDPIGAGAAMTAHFDLSFASMPRGIEPAVATTAGADAANSPWILTS
jgi:DNA-binding FadR family transcriptional regulator